VSQFEGIKAMSVNGGEVQLIARHLDLECGWHFLAADAEGLFLTEGREEQGRVLRLDRRGGPPTVLASGRHSPANIVIDAKTVYWSEHGGIWRIPRDGGVPTRVAATSYVPVIAIDESRLYWIEYVYSDTDVLSYSIRSMRK
jgi:hypothetical protein